MIIEKLSQEKIERAKTTVVRKKSFKSITKNVTVKHFSYNSSPLL